MEAQDLRFIEGYASRLNQGGGDLTKPRAAKRRARPAGGTRRTGVGSR